MEVYISMWNAQDATIYVVVEDSEVSNLSRPTSNIRGSFGVCDRDYKFSDLGGAQGDLMNSAPREQVALFLEALHFTLESYFILRNAHGSV